LGNVAKTNPPGKASHPIFSIKTEQTPLAKRKYDISSKEKQKTHSGNQTDLQQNTLRAQQCWQHPLLRQNAKKNLFCAAKDNL